MADRRPFPRFLIRTLTAAAKQAYQGGPPGLRKRPRRAARRAAAEAARGRAWVDANDCSPVSLGFLCGPLSARLPVSEAPGAIAEVTESVIRRLRSMGNGYPGWLVERGIRKLGAASAAESAKPDYR